MLKCIYGIEFYSSENCCYGYQIQINNQFMPILFNFIVFSNHSEFSIFFWTWSCIVITQIGRKKIRGLPRLFRRYCFKISLEWAFFANFLRGAWGEFYKSWLKSNKFQSFLFFNFTNCQFNCTGFCQGTLKYLKNYNFTFIRRRAAHCKTVEWP